MKHGTTTRQKVGKRLVGDIDFANERIRGSRKQKYLKHLKEIHAKKKTVRDGSPETVK